MAGKPNDFFLLEYLYVDRKIINKRTGGNGCREVNWIQQVEVFKEYIVVCRPVAK
jgi:hypothetical protein